MNFKCILIKPDLSTEERIGDNPYLFPEFSKGEPFKENERIDTKLPCGAYLHTSNRPGGTYVLITKQM